MPKLNPMIEAAEGQLYGLDDTIVIHWIMTPIVFDGQTEFIHTTAEIQVCR